MDGVSWNYGELTLGYALGAFGWACVYFTANPGGASWVAAALSLFCAAQTLRGFYYLLCIDIYIYRRRKSREQVWVVPDPPEDGNEQ